MSWWLCVDHYLGDVTTTLPNFCQAFQRKYFPPEARDRLEAQFMALVQGDNSVRRYESEFTRLGQYVHYGQEDEPMIIRKFLWDVVHTLGAVLKLLSLVDFLTWWSEQ